MFEQAFAVILSASSQKMATIHFQAPTKPHSLGIDKQVQETEEATFHLPSY